MSIKFICKYCKIQVMGKGDARPVLGKVHKKCCPRRRTHN